jgi:hypothetical protein
MKTVTPSMYDVWKMYEAYFSSQALAGKVQRVFGTRVLPPEDFDAKFRVETVEKVLIDDLVRSVHKAGQSLIVLEPIMYRRETWPTSDKAVEDTQHSDFTTEFPGHLGNREYVIMRASGVTVPYLHLRVEAG